METADLLWNIYIGVQRPIISNHHSPVFQWDVVLANPSFKRLIDH
jgi:hypothetical protein